MPWIIGAIRIKEQRVLLASAAIGILFLICVFIRVGNIYHAYRVSSSSVEPSTTTAFVAPIQHEQVILNAHLFGISEQSEGALPQTNLRFVVAGIMWAENSKNSKALIIADQQLAKLYKQGDEIAGGIRIHQILPKTIILEHDGQLEELPLKVYPLPFSSPRHQ